MVLETVVSKTASDNISAATVSPDNSRAVPLTTLAEISSPSATPCAKMAPEANLPATIPPAVATPLIAPWIKSSLISSLFQPSFSVIPSMPSIAT